MLNRDCRLRSSDCRLLVSFWQGQKIGSWELAIGRWRGEKAWQLGFGNWQLGDGGVTIRGYVDVFKSRPILGNSALGQREGDFDRISSVSCFALRASGQVGGGEVAASLFELCRAGYC